MQLGFLSSRKTAPAKASGSKGKMSCSIYFGPENDITADFSAQQSQSRKTRWWPLQRQFLSLPGSNINNFRTNTLDEEKTQNAESIFFVDKQCGKGGLILHWGSHLWKPTRVYEEYPNFLSRKSDLGGSLPNCCLLGQSENPVGLRISGCQPPLLCGMDSPNIALSFGFIFDTCFLIPVQMSWEVLANKMEYSNTSSFKHIFHSNLDFSLNSIKITS